jgi:hypothetical protein
MGYLHIDNLYKNQEILNFKECYALEKIHGTSAHITFKRNRQIVVGDNTLKQVSEEEFQKLWPDEIELSFFSGGASHEQFVSLFDQEKLKTNFKNLDIKSDFLIVYGEAYGGKMQGMSKTYGNTLKFVAFDILMGKNKEEAWWLPVDIAYEFTKELELEFVDYKRINATIEEINKERDKDSTQAIRNGMGEGHMREGVVLRPIVEYRKGSLGGRIICKHKRDEFKETKTTREVKDPNYLKVLTDAKLVAEEWVTEMRLRHVLDKLENKDDLGVIIKAMFVDIEREASGEIVIGKETRSAIAKKTVEVYKSLRGFPV